MIENIICTNKVNGNTVLFERLGMNPFMLKSVSGVSGFQSTVSIDDYTMLDGGQYLGSIQQKRNIVIDGKMRGDPDENRELLYRCFNTGDLGEITITNSSGVTRKAEYYPESVSADGGGIPTKTFQISLLCPDPYFYDLEESHVQLAGWEPAFKFQHAFNSSGEQLSNRTKKPNAHIFNSSGVKHGITVTITCSGDVKNPSVTNVTTGQTIKIGASTFPFTLSKGNELVITTEDNDKHIYSIRNGKSYESNMYLTVDSEFIKLQHGDNLITYNADEGIDNITIYISYRHKYRGI